MNILSLFDGMSCGYEALKRAGIKIDNYFASEIDRYAIQISKKNHPDIIHIGSVTDLKYNKSEDCDDYFLYSSDGVHNGMYRGKIDLLIGGSPCQDLSIAKKDGKGLEGEKSSLFFEYVRLLNETKPKYFLLENVASMKKADRDEITRILGVEPVMINSSLVSAQNRKRLYWVGKWNGTKYETVDIPQPEDQGILLKDILEDIPLDDPQWKPLDEKYIKKLSESNQCLFERNAIGKLRQGYEYFTPEAKVGSVTVAHGDNRRVIVRIPEATKLGYIEPVDGDCVDMAQPKSTTRRGRLMRYKSNAITTGNQFYLIRENKPILIGNTNPSGHGMNGNIYHINGKSTTLTTNKGEGQKISDGYYWRKLTPIECERLQTLTPGYTEGVSNSQRYKMIGNGWTVDIITHILSFLFSKKSRPIKTMHHHKQSVVPIESRKIKASNCHYDVIGLTSINEYINNERDKNIVHK